LTNTVAGIWGKKVTRLDEGLQKSRKDLQLLRAGGKKKRGSKKNLRDDNKFKYSPRLKTGKRKETKPPCDKSEVEKGGKEPSRRRVKERENHFETFP